MDQTWPLFGLFSFFSQCKDKYSTNFTINDKSIDVVLGSRTLDGMMESADKSTELWWHPSEYGFYRSVKDLYGTGSMTIF